MIPMKFLRYTGEPREQDAAYATALDDREFVVLDPWSTADENIEVHFALDGKRATVDISPLARDLLDVGALVYIADEIAHRSASDDRWTRTFPFAVPVADTAAWKNTTTSLSRCLSFLSGDRYDFTWMQRPPTIPGGVAHRTKLQGTYDAVCLFSGGVDSLLGAAQLLANGERILLVGHHADGVTSSAQRDLSALLARKYPAQASLLQVHVARSLKRNHRFKLPKKTEITHRSRSFLFLAAGAAVASTVGTSRLYIPENGLIAINAPLGPSRKGTLSTRTTHPRYIEQFNTVLADLGMAVHVQNPFVYDSKSDMVERVNDPDLRKALKRSVSCAHAGSLRWRGDSSVTHCGYCVPCLYRRAAFLGGGIHETGYGFDVFTELPEMTPKTTRDFRLLVRFARSVSTASDSQVIATVLQHGSFGAGNDGRELVQRAEMLRRWSGSFLNLARRRSSAATKKIAGL